MSIRIAYATSRHRNESRARWKTTKTDGIKRWKIRNAIFARLTRLRNSYVLHGDSISDYIVGANPRLVGLVKD